MIGGLFNTRETTRALADELALALTAISFDRRGRGYSGDAATYSVQREVEDVVALIDEVGGGASVYGHSSGAGLALQAAAAGLPITRLVVHEPPFSEGDEASLQSARQLTEDVRRAIEEDRRADAIARFMVDMGMPPDVAEGIGQDPAMQAVAPTMLYDFAVMGEATGGAIPEAVLQAITTPTLVLAGSTSPDFFRVVATRVAEAIPDAQYQVLDGVDHGAPADVVAPVVTVFVARSHGPVSKRRGSRPTAVDERHRQHDQRGGGDRAAGRRLVARDPVDHEGGDELGGQHRDGRPQHADRGRRRREGQHDRHPQQPARVEPRLGGPLGGVDLARERERRRRSTPGTRSRRPC